MDNDRFYAVISKLTEYLKSRSLKHIRDPRSLQKLAKEIVQSVDRAGAVWDKWEGRREEIAKAAACCWTRDQPLAAAAQIDVLVAVDLVHVFPDLGKAETGD
jgi:hypothetical protein